MAKLSILAGSTSQSVNIFIQDSSSTTGAGLTGLVFNTSSLVAYYALPKAAAVQITLATLAAITTAYSSGGFKEVDATNMPGWYRLDLPNAALAASSGRFVSILLKGATNMAPCPLEIELTGTDNQDAVRGGMTALPNANAAASGGLVVLGTNATAISFTAGMTISNASGDALELTSSGSNGNALNAAGNGSGAGIKTTAGATGNGLQIVGGATSGSGMKVSGTAGNAIAMELVGQGSAAGLSSTGGATGHGLTLVGGGTSGHGLNVTTTSGDGFHLVPTAGHGILATANGTSKHGVVLTGGTAGTSDGASLIAGTGGVDLRANVTGNVTGNLSGSAGSVTGAVGSVTGAAGSVTGAVGSVTGNVGGNVVGSVASVTAAVTISAGTGTGQLDFTSGVVKANTVQILGGACPAVSVTGVPKVDLQDIAGSAVSTSSAQLGVNAVNIGGTAAASATIGTVTTATTATNLTNAPTSGDFTSTMKTSLNASTPASITGSTGNPGANPTGSVSTSGSNTASTFLTNRTETVDDYWKDALVLFTSGSLVGQVKKVSAYNGSTKFITVVGAFTAAPSNTDTFQLVNR